MPKKIPILCAGYVNSNGQRVACGKLMGHTTIDKELHQWFASRNIQPATHGLCPECAKKTVEQYDRETG